MCYHTYFSKNLIQLRKTYEEKSKTDNVILTPQEFKVVIIFYKTQKMIIISIILLVNYCCIVV